MVESKLQHRPAGAPRSTTRATDEGRGGFGLYVHYPLCRTRCGYCDFPIVTQADFPHRAYADQVLCELEARAADYRALALNSIYFGGGTPSLWPVGEVARIVDRAVALFSGLPKLEVTLEANPRHPDLRHHPITRAIGGQPPERRCSSARRWRAAPADPRPQRGRGSSRSRCSA
jgi:coproporphyrinogen III oxidase-like Fe-S oxidoreductase